MASKSTLNRPLKGHVPRAVANWTVFATPARSTTTTMVIDSKNGDVGSQSARGSKKTFTDDLYLTFSSPLAWILVLALVITWSCVFVIMFDLTDYKTISGKERRLLTNRRHGPPATQVWYLIIIITMYKLLGEDDQCFIFQHSKVFFFYLSCRTDCIRNVSLLLLLYSIWTCHLCVSDIKLSLVSPHNI